MHDFVLCRPYRNQLQTTIQLKRLQVQADQQDHILQGLRARIFPKDDSTWLDLTFRLRSEEGTDAGQEMPAKVVLRRYHSESMLTTESRINSGDRPLPCSLVKCVVPEVACLGDQAEMSGTIFIDITQDAWTAEIRGENGESQAARASIRNVDFARLSWSLPETLEGLGTVDIERVRFGNQGISSMQAAISLESGWVSAIALHQMQTRLGVSLQPGLIERSPQGVHFQLGYLKFDISAAGLRLGGYEPSGGTMLGGRNRQALAWRPNDGWQEIIPLPNLVAVLQQSLLRQSASQLGLGDLGEVNENMADWLPEQSQRSASQTAQGSVAVSEAQ
jgi:hypothetical protein